MFEVSFGGSSATIRTDEPVCSNATKEQEGPAESGSAKKAVNHSGVAKVVAAVLEWGKQSKKEEKNKRKRCIFE